MSDPQTLSRKLNFMEGKIKTQRRFFDRFAPMALESNIYEAQLRYDAMQKYLEEYSGYFMQLIIQLEGDDANQAQERYDRFETALFALQASFLALIESKTPKSIPDTKTNANPTSKNDSSGTKKPNIKLPEFTLKKFDGKIESWPNFRDYFDTLINKADLSGIEKFYYLISCCKGGEAEDILNLYQVTSENYVLACQALSDRYENPKLLVDNLLGQMMKVKPITRDNPVELKNLYSVFNSNIKQLENQIKDPKLLLNLFIINIVSYRLDDGLRKDWESKCKKGELPEWEKLRKFLEEKCRINEQTAQSTRTSSKAKPRSQADRQVAFLATETNSTRKCCVCEKQHATHECEVLKNMKKSSEKESIVKEKGLCLNCLKPGHTKDKCYNPSSCKICEKRHNTILHPNSLETTSKELEKKERVKQSSFALNTKDIKGVLLSTAIVNLADKSGRIFPARALLDIGSESCFMTEKMAQILNLKKSKSDVNVYGLSDSATQVKNSVHTKLISPRSNFSQNLNFLLVSTIPNEIPVKRLQFSKEILPESIKDSLADPNFNCPSKIDIIIGAEVFWKVMSPEKRIKINSNLQAVHSEFGFVLSGSLDVENPTSQQQ